MTIPEIALAWLPLVDAVAKTTVILLAAAVASIVLRHASAALRHLVWTLALTSALFLPIASLALPKWQLPLFTVDAGQRSRPDAGAVEPADDVRGPSRDGSAPPPGEPACQRCGVAARAGRLAVRRDLLAAACSPRCG